MSVTSGLSLRAVLMTSMREEVTMTARVHKGRRAGPRPPKSKNGWNLRGTEEIDDVRKWMVARHQGRGRDWLVGVAAAIGALSVKRPVAVRNLRIGWIIAAGGGTPIWSKLRTS